MAASRLCLRIVLPDLDVLKMCEGISWFHDPCGYMMTGFLQDKCTSVTRKLTTAGNDCRREVCVLVCLNCVLVAQRRPQLATYRYWRRNEHVRSGLSMAARVRRCMMVRYDVGKVR